MPSITVLPIQFTREGELLEKCTATLVQEGHTTIHGSPLRRPPSPLFHGRTHNGGRQQHSASTAKASSDRKPWLPLAMTEKQFTCLCTLNPEGRRAWEAIKNVCAAQNIEDPLKVAWNPKCQQPRGRQKMYLPVFSILQDMMLCATHPRAFSWEAFVSVHKLSVTQYCKQHAAGAGETGGGRGREGEGGGNQHTGAHSRRTLFPVTLVPQERAGGEEGGGGGQGEEGEGVEEGEGGEEEGGGETSGGRGGVNNGIPGGHEGLWDEKHVGRDLRTFADAHVMGMWNIFTDEEGTRAPLYLAIKNLPTKCDLLQVAVEGFANIIDIPWPATSLDTANQVSLVDVPVNSIRLGKAVAISQARIGASLRGSVATFVSAINCKLSAV